MTEKKGPGGPSTKGHPGGHPGGPPAGGSPAGENKKTGPDLQAITDVSEKGAPIDGKPQRLDRRLFIQLLAFTGATDTAALIKDLEASGLEAVLYADVNNPTGVGLLTISEDPKFFPTTLREFLTTSAFKDLTLLPEYTLLGRTYAIGHERDLEDWLLKRSRRVASNTEWPWAVWYPLRRTGEFALLPKKTQGEILMEHGIIGRAFGDGDLGHDIRLICPGLDKNDNDFVIALIGKELAPLSKLVETMRSTKQTSTYIENMGPFFIGRAIWKFKYEG